MSEALPGFDDRVRVVKGGKARHRVAMAALAKLIRGEDDHNAHREATLLAGYGLADSLDRQEHNPQASEHVIATTTRAYLDVLAQLVPRVDATADPAQVIADALSRAVAESADPSAVRDPATS